MTTITELNENNSICSICLEEQNPGSNPLLSVATRVDNQITPHIGHRFHQNCIEPWFQEHRTCPVCRRIVTHLGDTPLLAPQRREPLDLSLIDPTPEPPIFQAIQARNTPQIQIIAQNGVPEAQIPRALLRITETGDLEMLTTFLTELERLPLPTLEDSLEAAVEQGFTAILQALLNHRIEGTLLDSETVSYLLLRSFETNAYADIIPILIQENPNISDEVLPRAIEQARARMNHALINLLSNL